MALKVHVYKSSRTHGEGRREGEGEGIRENYKVPYMVLLEIYLEYLETFCSVTASYKA